MTQQEYAQALSSYTPEGTADLLTKWIFEHNISVTIARDRKTKLGDFKVDPRDNILQISINGGLNPYAFLITMVHELAHALVYKKYGRRVKPHGIEWKIEYQDLMLPFVENRNFPDDILLALVRYMQNPKASSSADRNLYLALRAYDSNTEDVTYLQDLEEGEKFILQNKLFQKGKKRRTRFLCTNLSNGREYTVNALAEVIRA